MEHYRLIGAVGRPRNSAGWLVPILMNEAGLCFQLGESPYEGIPREEIDSFAQDEAVTVLHKDDSYLSIRLDAQDHETKQAPERWISQAYVFYKSSDASALLSTEDLRAWNFAFELSQSEEVYDVSKGESRFKYRFIKTDTLRTKLLPSLFECVRNSCSMFLIDHFLTMDSGSRDLTQFSDLCDLLTDLAYDDVSTDEAIRYTGLALLLGPNAQNFRAWLRTVLWHFEIPVEDPQHWRDKCLGILDKAATSKCLSGVRDRYTTALADPSLREISIRYAHDLNIMYAKAQDLLEATAVPNKGPEVQAMESEFEDLRLTFGND